MNALLRIQVQVAAREAQNSLRQLQTTINQVGRAGASMNRSSGGAGLGAGAKAATQQLGLLSRISRAVNGDMDRTGQGMIQLGKNMQWVGRQINFNFTLPLILAGRSAMTWALDNERAFTRVRKVYGNTGQDYTAELGKISTAIRMLSDYYGVNIADVTELAAQWAAAGATGAALAESVKNSLDLSILGDYKDLSDIFTQLITIQTAYKFSAGQLKTAIADLNTTENMTAATLPDLVTGIAKAGSSAELAGVNFQHLAAFMAVLVPATGSAANAGNALKTIFSRLAKPTQDTIDVLKEMGIVMASNSFQTLNGSEKLELMATKFATLTDSQKAFVAGTVGARWQVNKFAEIMQSITDKAGTYQKVLDAIDTTRNPGAETANLAAANREIGILLKSDPQKIKILTNSIKNLLIDAITPAIPVITVILQYIQALFKWFGNLSPTVQKLAIGFLLLVAAVGIGAQALGSFKLLFGTLVEFLLWAVQLIPGVSLAAATEAQVLAASVAASGAETVAAIQAAATAAAAAEVAGGAEIAAGLAVAEAEVVAGAASLPIALYAAIAVAFAAVVTLAIIFRKQIGEAINKTIDFIKRGFNSLPDSIKNALLAVARIVATIIKTIIHWLSYLNPFAKHSPSLVENVTAGVEAILLQYARLSGVGTMFRAAAADLEAFTAATKDAVDAAKKSDRADTKKEITKYSPQAGAGVDSMFANIDSLTALLGPINDAINKQQLAVDDLKASYDLASAAVDHYEASMKPLSKLVDDLAARMDVAKQAVQDYASTNIVGMKAASDAIFGNEMAQKKLRLELLLMDDAGKGFDDIKKKIDALSGDIETIRGTMTDLRNAGAGSDILKTYQDQLDALTTQKDSLTASAQSGKDLTDQLAALQRQGEILDLQKSLNFDPLLRQIDDLANGVKELPFDQIVAGITDQKSTLDSLTASYDTNKAALDAQQATLDQMIAARDVLKQSYDDENATLQTLKDSYTAVEDQISKITDALNAAVAASKTLTPAKGGGGGGGGGGIPFEDLTGQFDPTTLSGDLGSMQQTIDEWIAAMQKQFAGISLNPFDFVKKGWHITQDWWNSTAWPWLSGLGQSVWDILSNTGVGGLDVGGILSWFSGLPAALQPFFDNIYSVVDNFFRSLGSVIGSIPGIDLIGQVLGDFFKNIPGWVDSGWKALQKFWDKVGPAFEKFGELLAPAQEAFTHIWNVARMVFNGIIDVVEVALKVLMVVFAPFFVMLKLMFSAGWGILKDIIGPIWNIITGIVKSAVDIIRNTIKFVLDLINGDWGKAWNDLTGIVTAWWDGLWAILSGIGEAIFNIGADIINGLLDGISSVWDSITKWFNDRWTELIDGIKNFFGISSPSSVFSDLGVDMLTGLLNGIVAGAIAVWNFFTELPGKILGFLSTALTWLWDVGNKILTGAYNGIVDGATAVFTWFGNLELKILGYFLSALTWLFNVGKDIFTGVFNGVLNAATFMWNWFIGLPALILGWFTGAGTWLFDVGKKILQGLWDGMKDVWKGITGFVSGIGGWIGDHKGPPAYDAKLLVANGRLIMQGFQTGLMSGWKDTESMLKGMTTSLNGYFTGPGTSIGKSTVSISSKDMIKQVTFNGDLSFPNITDPNNADKFLQNLEVLASSQGRS